VVFGFDSRRHHHIIPLKNSHLELFGGCFWWC
jgi:hypothetical protein